MSEQAVNQADSKDQVLFYQVPGKGLYASYKRVFREVAHEFYYNEPGYIWQDTSGEEMEPSRDPLDYIAMIAWSRSLVILDEFERLEQLNPELTESATRAAEFGGYFDWTPSKADLRQMHGL